MAGISLTSENPSKVRENGLRPVNLQTDLAELADLIETAFSSTMDAGGRSAIREMRQLSRFGLGLGILSSLNDLAQGMSLGFVWVEDGRIVGNVSVYPADTPDTAGKTWIIANVAVYPAYRGRGIASRLMDASLELVRSRGRGQAVLQVDEDNDVARYMYRKLGFVEERTFQQWRRGRYLPVIGRGPLAPENFRVVGRKLGDSTRELALAKQVRPQERGGLSWLRPTHIETFRLSLWRRIVNWINLRGVQRLVVREADGDALRAWMQIETVFGTSTRQLFLMTHPGNRRAYADALVRQAVRRFGSEGLTINHPADEEIISDVLRVHQFSVRRTVVHMRHNIT